MKVAVVGLGVAGRSICRTLAERGYQVTGFDRQPEGLPLGSSRGTARIFRATPGEGAIYVDLAAEALAGWEVLERTSGRKILHWTPGVMAGDAESAFLRSTVALAQAHGHAHRVMTATEVAAAFGGFRLPAEWTACVLSRCAVLAADVASTALADAAKAAGAMLRFGAPAPALKALEAEYDRVVVAAGPWAGRLASEFSGTLMPVRKTVAEFEIAGPPPPLFCSDDEEGTYGMPVPGGRYKIGFDAGGVDSDPDAPWTPDSTDVLEARMRAYLPDAAPRLVQADACFYTRTPDLNFLIAPRPARPGTLVMSCCSGHGFKYGVALGAIAADWIDGRANRFARAFAAGVGRVAPGVPLGDEDAEAQST